jgi:hypothetical protein
VWARTLGTTTGGRSAIRGLGDTSAAANVLAPTIKGNGIYPPVVPLFKEWVAYTPPTGFYNARELAITNTGQYDGVYKTYTDTNSNDSRHTYNLFSSSTNNWYNNDNLQYGNVYLELPFAVELSGYQLSAPGYTPATPDEWTLYGSSDNGVTWTEIHNMTGLTIQAAPNGTLVNVDPPLNVAYDRFKWNFRKTTDLGDPHIGLGNLVIYALK